MRSVAIWCKVKNGHAYSVMEQSDVLQHTIDSKGGSDELHKGGGKGKLQTAFDVQDCRTCPQRKGSCKGNPLAKHKQCQCMCETSAEGAARRCRHTPRRRHDCSKCHTLACTGYCWIEHRRMCHLCWEKQLFLHLCYRCAIASADLSTEGYSQRPEDFLEERRQAYQSRQRRHGAMMAASAGIWAPGLNDLGLTPCPGCAALTEVRPSLEASAGSCF